ncbi:MAG: DNA polymerase III subunit delta' [Synechococcales bacterium]|nr:DNA polymerase III subunit delta' [Synechococcales bacterium]
MNPLFHPLIGQPAAIALLSQAIALDRIAPAYLFAGPQGVGKRLATTCLIQRLLQSRRETNPALLAQRIEQRNHPDLLWVEPTYLHQGKRLTVAEAEEAGVKRKSAPIVRLEQIREISHFLSRPPLEASRSIVVIEQTETLAEAAANALLKTLEEPGQATLILLAPSVESLLPTIVSRCQRIPFYRLSDQDLQTVLQRSPQPELLHHAEVLALAQGSPGAAIAQCEKLQALPEGLLEQLTQLPNTLRESLNLAKKIAKALDTETQIWLLDYLQQSYWRSGQASLEQLQKLEKAKAYLNAYVQPQLVWEVTLMQ